jgi:holin-like protein
MIEALAVLLLFQLAGEILARGLMLPVPGPVIGMLLLFGVLIWRGKAPDWLESTATRLLGYLSLLFVPAGVGVLAHLNLIRAEWLPILATLIGSTLITLAVTAGILQSMLRLGNLRRRRRNH